MQFTDILWWFLLVVAVFAAHWGADNIAKPLQKLRSRFGFSAAAGGAFIALATASPEIGTNTVSALRGLSDIGLGNLLGSNIVSVPVIVVTAYLATRSQRDKPRLEVESGTNRVQALPYLAVIGLVALLTLPAPWRGLQPVDAFIMLAAYAVYFVNALFRGRSEGEEVEWSTRESLLAAAGAAALVLGAYLTVFATERIVESLGISQIVGGLFITATLSVAPEVFATWSVAKSGQITSATTSVIADNTATMTLAFFPLALAVTPIDDLGLYVFNLAFVALFAALYAFFVWRGRGHAFSLGEIGALVAVYGVYLVAVIGFVL